MWYVLISVVFAGFATSTQSTLSTDELVRRIQTHLDEVHDFEARFRQRYHRQLLGKVIEESGVVSIKKPGRMRWDYLSPEPKLFLTNGSKTYFYLPEEKQVFVNHSPGGALGMSPDSPLSLLAGQSRLEDTFTVEHTSSEPLRGGMVLRLVPHRRYADIEKIELEVEPSSGKFLRVMLIDSLENRTELLFEDIKENQNIPDSLFLFTIPNGVDIVTDSESPKIRHP
jgi:outer membrane lipoprotein carrier protein